MMSKHTQEPWFSDSRGNIWRRPPSELYENGGGVAGDKPLAFVAAGWHGEGIEGYPVDANARRIVACVNACAGISTEQLGSWASMSRPIIQSIKELRAEADREAKQRDELLEALRYIEGLALAEEPRDLQTIAETARTAIAKATGGE